MQPQAGQTAAGSAYHFHGEGQGGQPQPRPHEGWGLQPLDRGRGCQGPNNRALHKGLWVLVLGCETGQGAPDPVAFCPYRSLPWLNSSRDETLGVTWAASGPPGTHRQAHGWRLRPRSLNEGDEKGESVMSLPTLMERHSQLRNSRLEASPPVGCGKEGASYIRPPAAGVRVTLPGQGENEGQLLVPLLAGSACKLLATRSQALRPPHVPLHSDPSQLVWAGAALALCS